MESLGRAECPQLPTYTSPLGTAFPKWKVAPFLPSSLAACPVAPQPDLPCPRAGSYRCLSALHAPARHHHLRDHAGCCPPKIYTFARNRQKMPNDYTLQRPGARFWDIMTACKHLVQSDVGLVSTTQHRLERRRRERLLKKSHTSFARIFLSSRALPPLPAPSPCLATPPPAPNSPPEPKARPHVKISSVRLPGPGSGTGYQIGCCTSPSCRFFAIVGSVSIFSLAPLCLQRQARASSTYMLQKRR